MSCILFLVDMVVSNILTNLFLTAATGLKSQFYVLKYTV